MSAVHPSPIPARIRAMDRTTPTLRERLQATGIRRVGGVRAGFRYRGARGAAVPAAVRRRIERLRIPPAWRRVVIAREPAARVQAIGMDGAGRWQYRYLQAHAARPTDAGSGGGGVLHVATLRRRTARTMRFGSGSGSRLR